MFYVELAFHFYFHFIEHWLKITFTNLAIQSNLIYNMSARHEQREYDTIGTSATQLRHERYTNDTSMT